MLVLPDRPSLTTGFFAEISSARGEGAGLAPCCRDPQVAATGRRLRHVLRARTQRPDHAGRRDRDGCLPHRESDISRCTGGTILGPALTFPKINCPLS